MSLSLELSHTHLSSAKNPDESSLSHIPLALDCSGSTEMFTPARDRRPTVQKLKQVEERVEDIENIENQNGTNIRLMLNMQNQLMTKINQMQQDN